MILKPVQYEIKRSDDADLSPNHINEYGNTSVFHPLTCSNSNRCRDFFLNSNVTRKSESISFLLFFFYKKIFGENFEFLDNFENCLKHRKFLQMFLFETKIKKISTQAFDYRCNFEDATVCVKTT